MAYFDCVFGGGSSGGGYELTVTCDADFAGTIITATDGVTTLTQTCPSASPYEVVFEIPNGGDWTISGTISGDVYSTSINIPSSLELHYISTPKGSTVLPTDDIQTWLACANITDKSYTTLAEVLADRETFETLIADSNACDYMARSTTWANDVADDADAMALIGKYDYCSNALLGNATWAEAIVNSDYADKVLLYEPLVPTMTSDTTPSGEAFTDSFHSDFPPFRAFDATLNSTFWASYVGTITNAYLGYDFGEPVIVSKVGIINSSYNAGYYTQGVKDFDIKYSDDKVTWSSAVYSGTATKATSLSQGWEYFNFTPSGAHRYWIIYCKNNYGDSSNVVISQLQFYGRKSNEATNTHGVIHTANGDTVYYINGQGQQVSIDASDFDFSSLDEGVYTFGSTTAKNPSDLSQDYTKQFRITKSSYGGTTELYLMPDTVKTLYWWGYEASNLEDVSSANGWTFSYTMQTPTHNVNEIDLSTSSGSVTKGIGSKESINANKIHGIVQSTGTSGNISLRSSKNFTTATSSLVTSLITGLNHIQSTEQSSSGYMLLWGTNSQTLKCKALWYE